MRHRLLPGVILAASVAGASTAGQTSPDSIETLVARYASGDHAAVRALDGRSVTLNQLTSALDSWIASGGPESERRRVIAAACFALDAVWNASRTYLHEHAVAGDPDGGGVTDGDSTLEWAFAEGRVAAWAAKRLPDTGPVDATERTLWLTAIGVAEDAGAWRRLEADVLPLASKRLPSEPRVRLATVVARTNISLEILRATGGTVVRNDILRDGPRSVEWPHWKKQLPQAIREFEPLLADPELAAEVQLRIGYFELRLREWPNAIARFEGARRTASEPFLIAAANYFAGWVHEQQKQPDEAVVAYRRALALAPGMRNLSTRLSALLFQRNEQTEAYALLEAAQKTRPASVDLLVALDIGDGRFVLEWLAEIRGALR